MGNWPCAEQASQGHPKAQMVHESFFPMYLVKARSERGCMMLLLCLLLLLLCLLLCLVIRSASASPSQVSDFLQMRGVPESHDVLKQRGLLHEWRSGIGMFAIFVSHQWLGRQHPDPTGEQVAVLRQMLRGLIDGSLTIEGDLVSSSYGQLKRLTSQTRKQVETGFLFFDWFAIPQITARVEGVNEEDTKSDAARAVKSIPWYVEAAGLFVALVPFVRHLDTKDWCSYTSWLPACYW